MSEDISSASLGTFFAWLLMAYLAGEYFGYQRGHENQREFNVERNRRDNERRYKEQQDAEQQFKELSQQYSELSQQFKELKQRYEELQHELPIQ